MKTPWWKRHYNPETGFPSTVGTRSHALLASLSALTPILEMFVVEKIGKKLIKPREVPCKFF